MCWNASGSTMLSARKYLQTICDTYSIKLLVNSVAIKELIVRLR